MTKDGNVLLREMQIQHPTAALIARAATAQDEVTGDGTTSNVLLVGEVLRLCERYLGDGVHARTLADGVDWAKKVAVKHLETLRVARNVAEDRELLRSVARSSLLTKVHPDVAEGMVDIVVDAVLCVRKEGHPIDLFMVETMHMKHKQGVDTRLVRGLVLDHGARHPDMPRDVRNAFVLTCNANLEYEKPEMNASVQYKTADEREAMVQAEHAAVDDACRKIVALKRQVCANGEGFVVVNQKGIDPMALDMLAKEGIFALRRAKRRNMERLTLACGGSPVNSFDDMTPDVLGFAGHVHEHALGEEKYTFIEDVKNPFSCTVLIRGPFDYTIAQIRDAVRDGLRAVKNTIEDGCVLPGGGAVECALSRAVTERAGELRDKTRFGALAFAEALLVIPKVLAENSGFDTQDIALKLLQEHADGHMVGLDLMTGEAMDPALEGVWDSYRVVRQMLNSASTIAQQLLLVDEIIKAGKAPAAGGGGGPGGPGGPGGMPMGGGMPMM